MIGLRDEDDGDVGRLLLQSKPALRKQNDMPTDALQKRAYSFSDGTVLLSLWCYCSLVIVVVVVVVVAAAVQQQRRSEPISHSMTLFAQWAGLIDLVVKF